MHLFQSVAMNLDRRQKFVRAQVINCRPSREALYIAWIKIAQLGTNLSAVFAIGGMYLTLVPICVRLVLLGRLVMERSKSFPVGTAFIQGVMPAFPVLLVAQRALTVIPLVVQVANRDIIFLTTVA